MELSPLQRHRRRRFRVGAGCPGSEIQHCGPIGSRFAAPRPRVRFWGTRKIGGAHVGGNNNRGAHDIQI
jgi:hypothetical protein